MKRPELSKCPRFIRKWLESSLDYTESKTPLTGIGVGFADAVDNSGRIPTLIPPGDRPATTASNYLHGYSVVNSSNNNQASLMVTPANHLDTTNGSTWIPKISGVYITNTIPPRLNVTNTSTNVYFQISVNDLSGSGATPAGAITALSINVASGAIPASTNTNQYQLVSGIRVVNGPNVFSVVSLNSGVSGSQVTQPCLGTILLGLQ